MGSSKTKTTENVSRNTNETTSGQTVPMTPEWALGGIRDFTSRIGDFADMDPYSFVPGASPLHLQAWNNVDALSRWQPQMNAASQMAQTAGNRPANLAGPSQSWNAPQIAGVMRPNAVQSQQVNYGAAPQTQAATMNAPTMSPAAQMQASSVNAPQLGNAAQTQASVYGAPQLGNANLVSAQGYRAPDLANAQGYAAARTGNPIGARSQGYDSAQVGNVNVGAGGNATSQSLLSGLNNYQNPFQQQVIDASLAQLQQEQGQERARLQANAARAGAFGGSRFGLAEGQFAADQALDRALLGANLRSQGFNTAAQLSESDTGRRQQSNLANAGFAQDRALTQAGLNLQTGLANQGASNEARQFAAQAANDVNRFNAGRNDMFALDQAARADQASQFGAGERNRFGLAQAGLDENAGQFNANLGLQTGLANQQARNQFGLAQAGLNENAARYGADARNAAGMANMDAKNQFALTGAGMGLQAGLANQAARQQTGALNMDAANQRASQLAQLQYGASSQNAGAQNAANLANLGARQQAQASQFGANVDRASQFAGAQNALGSQAFAGDLARQQAQAQLQAQAASQNAQAGNQFALFNAGQQDNAAARQLQSAGLMGSLAGQYAGDARADLGLMGQLGDQQRGIEQQLAMAPLMQLDQYGQFIAPGTLPYNAFVGQSVNGTTTGNMTGTGTSVTRTSPSLFNQLLAAGNLAAGFI